MSLNKESKPVNAVDQISEGDDILDGADLIGIKKN